MKVDQRIQRLLNHVHGCSRMFVCDHTFGSLMRIFYHRQSLTSTIIRPVLRVNAYKLRTRSTFVTEP
jgi:hypothetical protein